MKHIRYFLIALLLVGCAKQATPVPPSATLPPPTETAAPPTEAPTTIPTDTPIPGPTQDPLLFGAIGQGEIQAFSLEPVANAIFSKTMDGYIATSNIIEYQVTHITVFPAGGGAFYAELTYNVRTTDTSWLLDGGTQASDDWINDKCNRFDFVTTDTEFQLKNRENLQLMFKKILIANRGEIAIRIMRACKELGIRTVAVYSDADKNSMHAQFADEALPIESYLNADVLIQAALSSKADAIHPGYGFLSENASFAGTVESAQLTFIGPSADSIRAMGDKAESKRRMKEAGVPTVPGYEGLESEEDFKQAAKEIGYPVLIKASAGGGGKGMRVVNVESELSEAIESARREALNAFGDERLLIEKYLADAHHIEFQVFGDKHGNLVHLFERECSVQRRHQKIIEETPSPLLTPELRKQMGEAAVKAAKAVNYFNAGTIEFIFDPLLSSFFFLEMNTRLQVEHPITELTIGLDLVHWQIRVAAGEYFPYSQDELSQRGHAIECRIYAEDPTNGFLPSTGKLLQFIEPRGPGIRVDSGFRAGDTVTHFYDPMLAKLIVHGESRDLAIQKMQAALKEFIVHGVITNIDFLQDVIAHPDFANGKISTGWVEKNMESDSLLSASQEQSPGFQTLIAAALTDFTIPFGHDVVNRKSEIVNQNEPDPYSPWKSGNNFRN